MSFDPSNVKEIFLTEEISLYFWTDLISSLVTWFNLIWNLKLKVQFVINIDKRIYMGSTLLDCNKILLTECDKQLKG